MKSEWFFALDRGQSPKIRTLPTRLSRLPLSPLSFVPMSASVHAPADRLEGVYFASLYRSYVKP